MKKKKKNGARPSCFSSPRIESSGHGQKSGRRRRCSFFPRGWPNSRNTASPLARDAVRLDRDHCLRTVAPKLLGQNYSKRVGANGWASRDVFATAAAPVHRAGTAASSFVHDDDSPFITIDEGRMWVGVAVDGNSAETGARPGQRDNELNGTIIPSSFLLNLLFNREGMDGRQPNECLL